MPQESQGEPEEFDLRLEWPHDSLIEPLDPAARRHADEPAQVADDVTPEDGADEEDPAPPRDAENPEDPTPAVTTERRTFLRTLEPTLGDLVDDYEALVGTTSTFRDVVQRHLRSYLEEVGLMESVSGGYLKQYRDAHVRTLTEVRHLVGDNPAWVQWLADSVKDMASAVDDAAQVVRDLGDDARTALGRSNDSVRQMTEAVRWLGEQLQGSLRELHGVAPGAEADAGALVQSEASVERSLARLDEAADESRSTTDRDDAGRAVIGDGRMEKELARLTDEVRAARTFDKELAEDLLAQLQERSGAGAGDDGIRREIARLADELQALRRRLNLRAKTPVALEPEQIAEVADAVAAALGGGEPRASARRRPLEARRTTGTQTRRPRD